MKVKPRLYIFFQLQILRSCPSHAHESSEGGSPAALCQRKLQGVLGCHCLFSSSQQLFKLAQQESPSLPCLDKGKYLSKLQRDIPQEESESVTNSIMGD